MVKLITWAVLIASVSSTLPGVWGTAPGLQHLFTTVVLVADSFTGFLRAHETPDGMQTSIGIAGGNVTDHAGHLIGDIVPGLGGELGYRDSTGVYHVALTFTIKYLDGHYGVLAQTGYSGPDNTTHVWNHVTSTLKTDSPSNQNITNRLLIGVGSRVGGFIVNNHNTVTTAHYGLPIPKA